MNVKKLKKLGWNVYPNMLVKEQEYPYCKCVVALDKGAIKRVYWSCTGAPTEVKQRFLDELED